MWRSYGLVFRLETIGLYNHVDYCVFVKMLVFILNYIYQCIVCNSHYREYKHLIPLDAGGGSNPCRFYDKRTFKWYDQRANNEVYKTHDIKFVRKTHGEMVELS